MSSTFVTGPAGSLSQGVSQNGVAPTTGTAPFMSWVDRDQCMNAALGDIRPFLCEVLEKNYGQ